MGSCQSRTATSTATTPRGAKPASDINPPSQRPYGSDSTGATTQHGFVDAIMAQRRQDGHLTANVVPLELGDDTVPIEQVYHIVHDEATRLGEGAGGVVRAVQHAATGLPYAVKILELHRLLTRRQQSQQSQNLAAVSTTSIESAEAQMEALQNEITIMSQLDHPHIARLQEVYQDENHIYLVQEVCRGGDLWNWLYSQPNRRLDETVAQRIVWQILSSVRYLHSKGIVHRDLKLENFLFCTDRHEQVKMIDFGLSKHFDHPGEILHAPVGTPYAVAPEVIRGSYDEMCDLWAIGVLSYMLLCGEAPFGFGDSSSSLLYLTDNILAGRYRFDLPNRGVWATVNEEAKDFIRTLLVTNTAQRPTAAQAQEHPWMVRYQQQQVQQSLVVSPQIVQALVAFKELPITKRLMFEVISFTLMQDQIAHIQEEFEKLDQDGLGELSLENMRLLQRTEAMLPGDSASESCRLRNLSEAELGSIFERIKVGKAESRVHWHEFVAACLTTCNVNDGNIRIAFDRLDQNHDGFINYDAIVRMIARDADEDEDVLRRAWLDSVQEYHCQQSQFTYDDFCRLVRSYV